MATYGLRVRDSGGAIRFSVTDRITHYLYNWVTTTTSSETKTVPNMEDEKDIAVIIQRRDPGCGMYSWEKVSSTQIKITFHSAFEANSASPSANVYIFGY